jgi:hypothetical protein
MIIKRVQMHLLLSERQNLLEVKGLLD